MSSDDYRNVREEALRFASPDSLKGEDLNYVRATVRARLYRLENAIYELQEQYGLTERYIHELDEEITRRRAARAACSPGPS